MADASDIAGSNDFTEEKLRLHRSRTEQQIKRGTCLFCKAEIKPDPENKDKPLALYCDEDCKEDFERESMILAKTQRIIRRAA